VNETGRCWTPACTMPLVPPIGYIDRHTLALLVSHHPGETRMSAEQYGYVISAFSIDHAD
jgi:hypothetical protein